jgi:hypothetical protein
LAFQETIGVISDAIENKCLLSIHSNLS